MRIGEASDASGVPERMIRHYEKLGLVPSAIRSASGYRVYTDRDVRRLKFIALARRVGIPFDDVAELISGLNDPGLARQAAERLDRWIDEKSDALHQLRGMLVDAVRSSLTEQS